MGIGEFNGQGVRCALRLDIANMGARLRAADGEGQGVDIVFGGALNIGDFAARLGGEIREYLSRLGALFADAGSSTAENLMPSVLLPPITCVASSPVLGSAERTVKSLNGIGMRTEKDPLVETAGYHPDGSLLSTAARCISSFGCCARAATPGSMTSARGSNSAKGRTMEETIGMSSPNACRGRDDGPCARAAAGIK